MVRVPEYKSDVQSRPIHQSGVDVRANADHMGAAKGRGLEMVGRGIGRVAQGASDVGNAIAAVQELEDVTRAKEADNEYASWVRERMYGENGFMTMEGRNAVEARQAFEAEVEQKRKEFGGKLAPGAAKHYSNASQVRLRSVLERSIVHTANERKTWFKQASADRVSTFANDALVSFNNPYELTQNIAAGIAEIRGMAELEGWDAATLKAREAEFSSGVHKNITLRLAQDDPLAADAYMKEKAKALSGAHQYELRQALDGEIKNEQSKREADAILSSGRDASSATAPAGSSRKAGQAGPTRARAFLQSRSNKDASHVDGLDEGFATNLSAMIQDAPPGIREGLGIYSGYRSPAHQQTLWDRALKKYGSAEAARKWVAPPGKSYHNSGQAVDMSYNGQSLSRAPQHVRDWVHENAKKYGLYFPMGYEPWHIEPLGTRGSEGEAGPIASRREGVSSRAGLPSYDEIERQLSNISDPDVRDLTRKRIHAAMEAQSKATEQREKAAKAELWSYIDKGATPDQVPMETRQDAGMAAVSAAWSYTQTVARGREVESDETLLYDMRRYAASNPNEFAKVDLNDYRDRLGKDAIKELTDKQSTALSDQRKAREDGLNITTAFSQASTQLEAVGLTTTGKDGGARRDAAERIARFQNVLASEMDAFKRANEGKAPTQMEIQSMINRLLLPIVVTQEKSIWNPTKTPWTSTSNSDGFLFEAGQRPDGSTVDVDVKYGDIPIDLRRGIATDLERELGRKPGNREVVRRYEDIALDRERTPVEAYDMGKDDPFYRYIVKPIMMPIIDTVVGKPAALIVEGLNKWDELDSRIETERAKAGNGPVLDADREDALDSFLDGDPLTGDR